METELVKVLQLKYPTISYTNKLYEGNKKTLLTQTLHHKTLKLLPKIKTFFQLWRAANFALLRKLLRSYFVMIIRTLKYDLIYLQWLIFQMWYLKVCQNISFPFNLSCRLAFSKMQFTRYTIVANLVILSPCDVIKTLFRTPPCLYWAFSQRVFFAFYMPKAFSIWKIWSKFARFDSTVKFRTNPECIFKSLHCTKSPNPS